MAAPVSRSALLCSTAPLSASRLDRIQQADPKPEVFFRGLRSVYFFLPPAHRGARVIGTDAMRILLISQELSDSQERHQDNKDNPNINAHQSSPAA
jgi:hypothetical protein